MLTSLKETFSGRAAAIVVGGITMLSPMAAQADDARFTSSPSTSIEVAVERGEVGAQAYDYALLNSRNGSIHIGVSVLKGIDAPASGPEMAAAFEGGVEKMSNRPAEGFAGDNGNKATEVTFYVPLVMPDRKIKVQTLGPHNISDAADILRNWEADMAPAYTTISLD